MKYKYAAYCSSTIIAILIVINCYIPIQIGRCNEHPAGLYRFGVYTFEYNDEADPDLQIYNKVAGFKYYLGLEEIKCN